MCIFRHCVLKRECIHTHIHIYIHIPIDYIVSHVHIEKEKKVRGKKEMHEKINTRWVHLNRFLDILSTF